MDYEEINVSNSVDDTQDDALDVLDNISSGVDTAVGVAADTPEESTAVSTLVVEDESTGETTTIYLISVDELVERLTYTDNIADDAPVEETGELTAEPDTLTLFSAGETNEAETALFEVVETIRDSLDHPALTTPFSEYTVTEGLLLLAVLGAFVSKLVRMLKGGFSWLLW